MYGCWGLMHLRNIVDFTAMWIVCVFVYFITCFLLFLVTCLLIFSFFIYFSFFPFVNRSTQFQARCCKRRLNMTIQLFVFILC